MSAVFEFPGIIPVSKLSPKIVEIFASFFTLFDQDVAVGIAPVAERPSMFFFLFSFQRQKKMCLVHT